MTNRRNYRITTYQQAFEEVLGIAFDERLKKFVTGLEKDGHTEKSISFAIWRTKDELEKYVSMLFEVGFDNFLVVLKNEICKYSWTKDDPRWEKYKSNKERDIKINEYAKKMKVNDFVYFVQGENGGSIRIGYTINPTVTLKSLQNGYPDTLKLLVVIPGSEDKVLEYFNKFSKYKLKGGWYKPVKEIFDEIETLKAIYNQVEVIKC